MLLVSTALAYQLTGLDFGWQEEPLEEAFTLDYASFPSTFPSEPAMVAAIEDSLRSWNSAGSNLRARFEADPTEPAFEIAYVPATGGGRLAQNQSNGDPTGATRCTIRVYGANGGGPIDWYFDEDPSGMGPGQADFRTVLIHELGHCFGLDHTSEPDAVMLSSVLAGTLRRDLTDDDRAGMIAIYGEAPPTPDVERPPDPEVPKGCSSAPLPALGWLRRQR